MVVIAALAQGLILGSGVILGPKAGSAVGAGGGVFAEAVRTKGLTAKDGAFLRGMALSTARADKCVVCHEISSDRLILGSKETAASPLHMGKPLFSRGVTSFHCWNLTLFLFR